MQKIQLPDWLIRLVIIVALPTVSCFGYYTLDYIDTSKGWLVLLVIAAYPTALIGVVGFFMSVTSSGRNRFATLLWAICVLVPVIFIGFIRA